MVNLGPEFWDPTMAAEQSVLDAKVEAAKTAVPTCAICGREPGDIPDLVIEAAGEGDSPEEYAKYDGTYSAEHNKFTCDECYVKIGAPPNRILVERY